MIHKLLRKAGYTIIKNNQEEKLFPDLDKNFWDLYHQCKPYTMNKADRVYALYQAVHYVIRNNIPGDFVECGVWKGGNPMMMMMILRQLNVTDRKIFLYDTFDGMSAPTGNDKNYKGKDALDLMKSSSKEQSDSVWCYSPIDEVRNNLKATGYPEDKVVFVKGKVEDTIPQTIPDKIALLRLDTDWYESTYHEFKYLFPVLSQKGVLIVDDYGYWEGCRKATDQYLSENKINLLLHRIDGSARIGIKG